jgi:hypothetical protein
VNALKKVACLVAEALIPKGMEVWVIHEGDVFLLFVGYWMDHCVGNIMLGSMICSQGNGHVGCFHAPEIIL